MKKFLTEYKVEEVIYGSHVFASDLTQAHLICNKRNIGEYIIGIVDDITINIPNTINDELHEACFLSFICLNAKTISIEKILGDKGIVHEYIHLISQNDKSCSHKNLRAQLDVLRKSTPGYTPVSQPL